MPLTQKAYTRFNKGLVTEAGELTFPEGASVSESNCTLERTGARNRRLSLEYEDSFTLSGSTISKGSLVSTGEWTNVGGQANLQYSVVQQGPTLYFYNKSVSPISGQAVAVSDADPTIYSVDLTAYETSTGDSSIVSIQLASINGALVVASSEINTFSIERNKTTGVFTLTTIAFRVRDFTWQGDRTTYSTELATGSLTQARKYDTANVGWNATKGGGALTTYETAHTAYPPLTHPWYSGKDANGAYADADWLEVYSGTTLIANGHYILDLFSKDRKTAFDANNASSPSTALTLATETEATRFRSVATFSGRVFYAGLDSQANSGKIYFSQQIESLTDIGECFQVNDPTSEEIPDLLATDGGFIVIPDAHSINKLSVVGASLFVFAENGVWQITGIDDSFKATDYSVRKVTDAGLINVGTHIRTEDAVFWWSPSGIHALSFSAEAQKYIEQNISLGTIQTHYLNIGADSKLTAIAEYDTINKQIFWMHTSGTELLAYKYNEILILDIALQAFIPWTVSDLTSNTAYIAGTAFFKGVGYGEVEHNVVDSDGVQVVDASGALVVATFPDTTASGDSEIKFLVRDGGTGKMTFATFSGTDFLDWGAANYSSFAEAGYDFLGDMSTRKTVPYVNVYCKVTETGWTGNEIDGYVPTREGSIKVSAKWDFKSTVSSPLQQGYRLKYTPVVDTASLSTFTYPSTVIRTKLKVRGSGRSLHFRFESEEGKDFSLLGYEVIGDRSNKF